MRILLAAVMAAILTAPALAAEPATSAVVGKVVACRAEADPARRLACYDAAVGAFADATAKGDVKVVDREEVRKTRRSLFGFTLPKLPFFTGDDSAADETAEVELGVVSVSAEGYGRFTLVMDDGSTWRSTEPFARDPRAGSKAKIKKGALGAYFLSVGSGRAVRATRIG